MATITTPVSNVTVEPPVSLSSNSASVVHPAYVWNIADMSITTPGVQKQAAENFNWG